MQSITHAKLDHLLIKTRIGELTTGGLAGGSFLVDLFNWATPVAAFLGALLAVVAGWYTMRLKRLEYQARVKEINVQIELEDDAEIPPELKPD